MLMDWIRKFKIKPQKVFIVHGEAECAEGLSKQIKDEFKIETIIPDIGGDKFTIEKQSIELSKTISIEPSYLKEDIEAEIENIYDQLRSLNIRKDQLMEPSLLERNMIV